MRSLTPLEFVGDSGHTHSSPILSPLHLSTSEGPRSTISTATGNSRGVSHSPLDMAQLRAGTGSLRAICSLPKRIHHSAVAECAASKDSVDTRPPARGNIEADAHARGELSLEIFLSAEDESELDDIADGCVGHDSPGPTQRNLYQSITATSGLSQWSFEELRAECYAQSQIATCARPPNVPLGAPLYMIIPPAFRPCFVTE